MAWVRIDDNFCDHDKALSAGGLAVALWLEGLCYANKHLTDGVLKTTVVARMRMVPRPLKVAETLVAVGLWDVVEGGYQIHDYHEHYPSADDVKAGREGERRRKSLYADPALVAAIRERDDDHCRYCGRRVHWHDRRGPVGAQFDHVDPRGASAFENIVVACRGCNIKKHNKTPAAAGMTLLAPGTRAPAEPAPRTSSELDPNQVGTKSDSSHVLGLGRSGEVLEWKGSDFWDLWCRIAHGAGARQPLQCTPGEYTHIDVLLRSYSRAELEQATRIWWASPHVHGRNIWLFRTQIGEVLQHITSGAKTAFLAPPPRGDAPREFDADAWARKKAAQMGLS